MLYERYKVRIVYERFASSSTNLEREALNTISLHLPDLGFSPFFFFFSLLFFLSIFLSLSLVFFIKIILIIITARDYYYDQTK